MRRLAGGFVLVLFLWIGLEWLRWPQVEKLAREPPESTAFIDAYRSGDSPEGELRWSWVPYEEISPHLKVAVLVGEDIDFFSHNGFATEEIKVALRQAAEERRFPRGASTITQQLAKNLWLSPSRNPWRKVKEAVLTRQLEQELEKRRILELYLNVVELGAGIYGVEAASQSYFGKSASRLTPKQAAMLAASLPRPSSWHPGSDSSGYASRVETLRRRMARAQWLRNEI